MPGRGAIQKPITSLFLMGNQKQKNFLTPPIVLREKITEKISAPTPTPTAREARHGTK